MAYSDQTEFPRGIAYSTLGSAYTPFALGVGVRVKGITVSDNAGSVTTYTISNADGSTVIGALHGAARATMSFPSFFAPDGLRIVADTAHALKRVTITYYDD